MKTTALIAALLTAATLAIAQTPPPIRYEIEANYQQEQELPDQDFVQGAGVVLRYYLKTDERWWSLAGLGARWQAMETVTSTNAYQSTGTIVTSSTPNYIQFNLTSAQTGTAVTNWVYRLFITNGGVDYPMGVGDLDIAASTWTGAAAVLSNVTAAAYTDAAVATHAAVVATTNSLGHIIVGSGLSIDGSGVLSNPQSVPAWGDVTGKPFTNLVDLVTPSLVWDAAQYPLALTNAAAFDAAGTSAALSNALGTAAFTASTNYATAAQGATADTALQPGATDYVAANGSSLTNAAATASTVTNMLDLAGTRTMTGAIKMGTNGLANVTDISEDADVFTGNTISLPLAVLSGDDTWRSTGTATNGTDIVNYQTMTGMGYAVEGTDVTFDSYAVTSNRLAIPAATQIGTNATYAISYADGAYQVFGFSSTNDLTLTLTGPGTGNRAYSEVTFTNYTYRAVTWPTNNATWINTEPTGAWARVGIDWVDMNGTVEAALINTTPTGE